MPTPHKKAPHALKGFNHRINSANSETAAQKETTAYCISSCVRKGKFAQLETGSNTEANTLPSPFRCFERGAVAFSAGGTGEESEQPDASAAATLRLLPEAGSSAHREVAPEEMAYMTASLCSLLPQFIHV